MAELDPLSKRVLEGSGRELKLLAARGLLPLPPDQLIPLQVRLAQQADPEVAGRAAAALRATEPAVVVDFITNDASEIELGFLAEDAEHPAVLEALLRRRDLPHPLMAAMAARVDRSAQEVLILRQDAIVESSEILDSLETNPKLDNAVRRRIREYREHLLRPEPELVEEAPEPVQEPDSDEEVTEEELEAAIESVREEEAKGDLDDVTGLSEGQIRLLPVPIRRRLTQGASRTMRSILIRDTNPMVAVSVLTNNRIGDEEAEQIARNRSVCDDVLLEVGRRREWVVKAPIIYALVNNPRTPVGVSVRLVSRLGMRDLRSLSRNRNVPDAVRSQARRLFQARTK